MTTVNRDRLREEPN